jgi:hypothetical protein
MRKYRADNRGKLNEQGRKYRADNRGQIARYKRKHYNTNRERIAERRRTYCEANREKVADQRREYAAAQPGGVYRLTCIPTGDVYFGSTGNLQNRRRQHFHNLRKGDHQNPRMRELSKFYSEDDFRFQTLILCDPEEALYYEQKLIELKPCCNDRNVLTAMGRPII